MDPRGEGGVEIVMDQCIPPIEPPAELTEYEATLEVREAWDFRAGSGAERLGLDRPCRSQVALADLLEEDLLLRRQRLRPLVVELLPQPLELLDLFGRHGHLEARAL